MSSFAWCFITYALGILGAYRGSPPPAPMVASVTVTVLDSFGHPRAGCYLFEFLLLDGGAYKDYKDRFSGLTGKDIPFGDQYRARVKCADGRGGGPFYVSVDSPDQLLVLAVWLHRGDYFTGLEPRLTVSVSTKSRSQPFNESWVKIVGVYVDRHEVAKVDPKTHAARFYNVEPSRCLVLLLTTDKLLCAKQIDILDWRARLNLSFSDQGCKAEGTSSVRVID